VSGPQVGHEGNDQGRRRRIGAKQRKEEKRREKDGERPRRLDATGCDQEQRHIHDEATQASTYLQPVGVAYSGVREA
jgi:hypothetical protein